MTECCEPEVTIVKDDDRRNVTVLFCSTARTEIFVADQYQELAKGMCNPTFTDLIRDEFNVTIRPFCHGCYIDFYYGPFTFGKTTPFDWKIADVGNRIDADSTNVLPTILIIGICTAILLISAFFVVIYLCRRSRESKRRSSGNQTSPALHLQSVCLLWDVCCQHTSFSQTNETAWRIPNTSLPPSDLRQTCEKESRDRDSLFPLEQGERRYSLDGDNEMASSLLGLYKYKLKPASVGEAKSLGKSEDSLASTFSGLKDLGLESIGEEESLGGVTRGFQEFRDDDNEVRSLSGRYDPGPATIREAEWLGERQDSSDGDNEYEMAISLSTSRHEQRVNINDSKRQNTYQNHGKNTRNTPTGKINCPITAPALPVHLLRRFSPRGTKPWI